MAGLPGEGHFGGRRAVPHLTGISWFFKSDGRREAVSSYGRFPNLPYRRCPNRQTVPTPTTPPFTEITPAAVGPVPSPGVVPTAIGPVPSPNPNGIPPPSPGLRPPRHPGHPSPLDDNPNGVVAHRGAGGGRATTVLGSLGNGGRHRWRKKVFRSFSLPSNAMGFGFGLTRLARCWDCSG
jgi:hypothetical protein